VAPNVLSCCVIFSTLPWTVNSGEIQVFFMVRPPIRVRSASISTS